MMPIDRNMLQMGGFIGSMLIIVLWFIYQCTTDKPKKKAKTSYYPDLALSEIEVGVEAVEDFVDDVQAPPPSYEVSNEPPPSYSSILAKKMGK